MEFKRVKRRGTTLVSFPTGRFLSRYVTLDPAERSRDFDVAPDLQIDGVTAIAITLFDTLFIACHERTGDPWTATRTWPGCNATLHRRAGVFVGL